VTTTGGRHRPPSRSARPVAGALSWVSGALRFGVALVLVFLTGLVAFALIPQAFGLDAHVVVSGSMAPQVRAGDVVLTQPVDGAPLRPGQVLLFADPQRPDGLLLHRLVAVDEDGLLVTRGDANQSDDSVHVAASDVRGLARVRVPLVGLPALWRVTGEFGHIALSATLLAAAAVFVSRHPHRRSRVGARPLPPMPAEHRSSPGVAPPMTGGRPAAVTHARTGRADEEGVSARTDDRAPAVPPPPAAHRGRRRSSGARRPGHRRRAAAAHAHRRGVGDLLDQPAR
jgi:signal peptidase